jgi:DNA-binding CsgD family transcriptional regulator/pimeloyl-ACP methyl ester carboxylesterase
MTPTMDAPPVQYVRTSDGYDIAYGISGDGPPLIAVGSTGFEHIQVAWEIPRLNDWLTALAARFRLIQVDRRGSGLSTRDLPPGTVMEDFQRDIEAVVAHLKLERFFLYGALYHLSYIPVQYAVQHPDSVAGLILAGTGTALAASRVPGLFDTVSGQDWDIFLRSLAVVGRGAQSADEVETIVERYRQCWHQNDFFLMSKAASESNLGEWLAQLTTPTLLLHPRGYTLIAADEPARVARLAGAKLVSIDGRNATEMDASQGMHAIDNFLAELPPLQQAAGKDTGIPASLSPRELEVLHLLAAGKTNDEIAEELVISRNTVRHHVSSILDKTGVANRAQAAIYARDHGIA